MPISYIRIDEDPEAETNRPGLIVRVLSKVLPSANPDFETEYRSVSYWYLEITDSKPTREIGFDRYGEPIVLGPLGANYGVWTDSPVTLHPSEFQSVTRDRFEAAWRTLSTRLDGEAGHDSA